jgi:hypothetical protein
LEPIGESATLLALRSTVANMVPQVDLPELLLEVHAWTGYLDAFTHVSEAGSRMSDLATSVAAVLIAQGCNLGFIPVMKPGHPALTRDRLSHVEQSYLRAETLAAANARLIHAQAGIELAQLWGGGAWSPPSMGCGSSSRSALWTPAPTLTTSAPSGA